MAESTPRYIPALGFRWLTAIYDPLLKWGMHEVSFKQRLVERTATQPGEHVLDLGCGTGTLSLMLKRAVPGASITGIDGDLEVLAIATSKSRHARLDIVWDYGLAYELPYPENSFDAVVSSLVLHHLCTKDKLRAFQEVHRVLRNGGRINILDFGPPISILTRMQTMIMAHLEETADNFSGRIPVMLKESGFDNVSQAEPMKSIFGAIWFYQGVKQKRQ